MMRTYVSSGVVPIAGGLYTVVGSLATAVVCGFAYAYAFHWMPISFLRLLVLFIYCFLVGIAVVAAARR